MLFKVLSVAVFAAVVSPLAVQAQTVAQIGGPAENPPAGFKGQQYVDSRGCVFLKAGYGGRATWVPRVSRDRRALCGFPPTGTTRAPIEMAEAEIAPAPKVERAPGPPMETIASLRVPKKVYVPQAVVAPAAAAKQPAPYAETAPRRTYEVAARSGVPAGKIGCYTSAPVAELVKLQGGGTAVVCTRGDGTTIDWRPPVYPDGAGVGAALHDPQIGGSTGRAATKSRAAVTYAEAEAAPTMPKGYKAAWKDDRLNPNRGKGTARGQADQDQVWTRDVPAQLVTDQVKKKKGKSVVVSTRNAATAPVKPATKTAGALWLQIGTFGVPANAQGAAQRLAGMGLPVAKSRLNKGGKALEIVLAGPFGSAADAKAALAMARKAGFGDAFLR